MSEPDLAAYLAGELDADQNREIERELARDPAARARAEALEKTFALLDYLPEPTPTDDFATRTLTLIAASHEALTLPASRPVAVKRPRDSYWIVAGLIALAVGAIGGVAARSVGRDPVPVAVDLAADYRVSVRLPWYLGCDDLAFARELAKPGLFPPDAATPPPALLASPSGPADKLIALFQSLPRPRREQLRKLDMEFSELPVRDRETVSRSLDAYAGWLDALPPAERQRVFMAERSDRLDMIRNLRGSQAVSIPWPAARFKALAAPGRVWPFDDPVLTRQTDEFLRDVLKVDLAAKPEPGAFGRLSRDEFVDLRARRDSAVRDGTWGLYGLQIARLAALHPTLPEPIDGPLIIDRAQLPPEFLRAARKHQLLLKIDRAGTRGRWPEYALELAEEARKVNVAVPEVFGPCRPTQLTPAIRKVIAAFTEAERAELATREGRWPEYPRELLRLARGHDLPVPGVTLPGAPSQWLAVYGR